MKTKTTLIALVVLVVLAALVLWQTSQERKADAPKDSMNAAFPSFARAEVAKIHVEGPEASVELAGTNGTWVLSEWDDFPADQSKVDRIMTTLADLRLGILITTGNDEDDLYELSSNAVKAKVYDDRGQVLVSLIIGEEGADFNTTFYRIEGRDDVRLATEDLRWTFPADYKKYYQSDLFTIDRDDIQSITLSSRDDQTGELSPAVTLEKGEDGAWQIVLPQEYDTKQSAVSRIVSTFSTLQARDIPPTQDEAVAGLDKPLKSVTVKLADDETKTLYIGRQAEESADYYARPDGSDVISMITHYQFGEICPDLDKLREFPKVSLEGRLRSRPSETEGAPSEVVLEVLQQQAEEEEAEAEGAQEPIIKTYFFRGDEKLDTVVATALDKDITVKIDGLLVEETPPTVKIEKYVIVEPEESSSEAINEAGHEDTID